MSSRRFRIGALTAAALLAPGAALSAQQDTVASDSVIDEW